MTHHTDAARAEFEAWFEDNRLALIRGMDQEELHAFTDMQPAYWFAWKSAWQAARRTPAAPASEPELEAALDAMDKEVTRMQPDRSVHWSGFTRDDRLRVVAAALAAAPQPPEAKASVSNGTFAAPVQLPEPVAYQWLPTDNFRISGGPVSGAYWNKLYTEQQVRELLANHGIQEQST